MSPALAKSEFLLAADLAVSCRDRTNVWEILRWAIQTGIRGEENGDISNLHGLVSQ
jgi:hypothetical protein